MTPPAPSKAELLAEIEAAFGEPELRGHFYTVNGESKWFDHTQVAQKILAALRSPAGNGMRGALESLLGFVEHLRVPQTTDEAGLQIFIAGPIIERARAALASPPSEATASPSAEPVAWRWRHPNWTEGSWNYQTAPLINADADLQVEPFYASPPVSDGSPSEQDWCQKHGPNYKKADCSKCADEAKLDEIIASGLAARTAESARRDSEKVQSDAAVDPALMRIPMSVRPSEAETGREHEYRTALERIVNENYGMAREIARAALTRPFDSSGEPRK